MPGSVRSRYTTFLVALTTKHDGEAGRGAVVYAAMKRSAAEALEAVQALADPSAHVAVVGSLSTRTAKAIRLRPDEVRLV